MKGNSKTRNRINMFIVTERREKPSADSSSEIDTNVVDT